MRKHLKIAVLALLVLLVFIFWTQAKSCVAKFNPNSNRLMTFTALRIENHLALKGENKIIFIN